MAAFEPPRILLSQLTVQTVTEYTAGPANTPPSAPSNVAATTPADTSSTITWDAATDVESDPLQYEGEYWDGAAWEPLFSLATFGTLTYAWNTTALADGSAYKARIRAHDGTAYGDWAESNTITVDHPDLPGAPVISAVVDSDTQFTVTFDTPGSGADSHALYVALSPTDLFAAGNLYVDALSSTPAPVPITGRTAGLTYYVGARATNTDGSTDSAIIAVTIPLPSVPTLEVLVISDEGAQLHLTNIDDPADAAYVQFETTSDADTSYATQLNQSGTLTDSGRFVHTVDGLAASTDYRSRVRYSADGVTWSDWIEAEWTTLAAPPTLPSDSYWYAPEFGEAIRGTYCATMAVEDGRSIVSVEISDDDGATWSSAGTATAASTPDDYEQTEQEGDVEFWEVCVNTLALSDGDYLLRFTLDDATVVEHTGFLIDNAEVAVGGYAADFPMTHYSGNDIKSYVFQTPSPRCLPCITPGEPDPETGVAPCVESIGNTGKFASRWGPTDPDWLTYNHGVRVYASFLNMSPGAPGFTAIYPVEFNSMGVELFNGAVKIYVTSLIMGGPCFPNEGYGNGIANVRIGSHGFSVLTRVSGGLLIGASCWPYTDTLKCGSYGGWAIRAEVYRPDPTNFPNRYRVFARFPPPRRASSITAGRKMFSTGYVNETAGIIDEIVDLDAPLECGPLQFYTDGGGGFYNAWSMRFLTRFSVQLLEEAGECGPVPEVPATVEPVATDDEFTPSDPCSLKLFVYDDDRETVLWETATDPAHLTPYLCDPENYGEQEIDIVAGAATIGQVEVIVIDRRTNAGDQDSGWLTDKLADGIHGRRCRLIRYISLEHGWIVIADGPAGTPSMDTSYSGFRFVIRDTRETERKIPAFVEGGTTTLLPAGVLNGFGPVTATEPIIGTWKDVTSGSFGLPASGRLSFESYWPGGTASEGETVPSEIAFSDSVHALFLSQSSIDGFNIQRFSWPGITILWRPEGSTDPYTEYTPSHFIVSSTPISVPLVASHPAVLDDGTEVNAIYEINWAPSGISWGNPVENEQIEIIILWTGRPSETAPMHIEGITTGALLQNLYDGVYSPRDTETGAIVPTGIRYDADALALMTDIVRLRITEPVKDARAWSEKNIYAPTGWVPAIDNDGRVSPRSQIPPSDFSGLTEITNNITEPQPNWDAGERIVNVVEFTYPRFYHSGAFVDAGDGIAVRDITKRHVSETLLTRLHAEELVEYDGSAFGAIGDSIGGQTEDEQGEALALLRKYYVLDRYENGAQAIRVPIMREYTHQLRAGDWVNVDLSWFPDYATRRRGMITGGQIMAIADLDCKWREALIEEAFPVLIPADYS